MSDIGTIDDQARRADAALDEIENSVGAAQTRIEAVVELLANLLDHIDDAGRGDRNSTHAGCMKCIAAEETLAGAGRYLDDAIRHVIEARDSQRKGRTPRPCND